MTRSALSAVPFAVALTFGMTTSGVPANAQVTVDGYTVTTIAKLKKPVLPKPTPVSYGGVFYLVGGNAYPPGADPFAGIKKLAGKTPFLSLQPGSTATFGFSKPATELTIYWGSVDSENNIQFFDSSMHQIGQTLSGFDLENALGILNKGRSAYITISSDTPFSYAILEEGLDQCCFEFSNVSGK